MRVPPLHELKAPSFWLLEYERLRTEQGTEQGNKEHVGRNKNNDKVYDKYDLRDEDLRDTEALFSLVFLL